MAIIIEKYAEIETPYYNLKESLARTGAKRFCFDFGLMNKDFEKRCDRFSLVPLEDFACERIIKYRNGESVTLQSQFGLFRNDFINVDVQHVELAMLGHYIEHGVVISRNNPYYSIVNQMAKEYGFVSGVNDKSFIIGNSELMELALVPFKLKVNDRNDFVVFDVEDTMKEVEFDRIVDSYASKCAI